MAKLLTKEIKIAVLFLLLITGCKKKEGTTPAPPVPVTVEPVVEEPAKEEPAKEEPAEEEPEEEVPDEELPVSKAMVPVKLEASNSIITFSYLPESNLISEILNSDGTRELYLYTDKKQLKEYDRYKKNEKVYAVYYLRNAEGHVIQGNQNNVESNGAVLSPAGSYKIAYNSAFRLNSLSWYDSNRQLTKETTYTYSPDGKLLHTSTSNLPQQSFSYVFDDKNGVFQNVTDNQVFSIESLPNLLLSAEGNALNITAEEGSDSNYVFTYTYNADKYPEAFTMTDAKGIKKTYKVTYK